MARVRVVEPHRLDLESAKERVRRFLASPGVRDRLDGAEVTWVGSSVEIRGEGFEGRGHVTPKDVEFDLELGGFLALFASAAESELKTRLAEALR